MKILITGATGMLGTALSKTFNDAELLNGKADLDLTDLKKTSEWLQDKFYSVIIHSAAFTNMKFCEDNKEKSKILHAAVIDKLKNHCERLVYISTIPVWNKPSYSKSVYFETKKLGEERTLSDKNNLVIRTNIYGPLNLVDWAYSNLKNSETIKGFRNSYFNPVHVRQLSSVLETILNKSSDKQIYTISGDRVISKYDFLKEVAKKMGFNSELILPYSLEKEQDLILENPDEICFFEEGMEFIKDDYKN